MTRAKRRPEQHLIDEAGEQLLRSKLPRHWVTRSYRPDYGLDLDVEVFCPAGLAGENDIYETLGEHFFIQLKSTRSPKIGALEIFGRPNVEKQPEALDRKDKIAELETYRMQIETPELVTVERMGIGVPVLLVVADLTQERCSFVCLNDYVDKILIPRQANYGEQESHTIHVPTKNEIGTDFGLGGLRWYAKRAKLLAAFQRFTYQFSELQHRDNGDWTKLAKYFARRIAAYDFWTDTEMCMPITSSGLALTRFIQTGQPGLLAFRAEPPEGFKGKEFSDFMKENDVRELWRQLANLPKMFEDIWREWFLPTGCGYISTGWPDD